MLSNIIHSVYIDPEWVAAEYLRRCKKGAWNKADTDAALKIHNLERMIMINAMQFDLETPEEVGMEEFIE
eukprot:scaffold312379_cov215-Cyclotella_meneghiniana.AAC.1